MSESQSHIVNKIFNHFKAVKNHQTHKDKYASNIVDLHNNNVQAPLLLMTGDPGSGKSYVIETVMELATMLKIGSVAATSFNGIAAVNIDGSTICSTYKIF